jgi:hypothetical protein
MATTWTNGDNSGSQTLTDNDSLYPGHINELRTAVNAVENAAVLKTGDQTVAGVKTFTSDPVIPDEAYGADWNGSLEPPTKNAVYDKIETLGTSSSGPWIQDTNSWNRIGDHSFAMAGNQTEIYTPGTRVRYKQGGAYKYGVVRASVFGDPDTTIHLATNTDYTIVSPTAITDTYYSYQECPPGYPDWFAYSPTFTGFSSAPTNVIARFRLNATTCNVFLTMPSDTTSNATNFKWTVPITSRNQASYGTMCFSRGQDNGAVLSTPVLNELPPNSSTVDAYPSAAGGNWTASGNKRVFGVNLFYEI